MLNFVADRLELRYGAVQALRGVSFTLAPGKILAIAGESGCGKSSLARVLVGLIRPQNGCVKLDNLTLDAQSRAQTLYTWHKKVQMVFQDPHTSLNPRMRIDKMFDEVLRVNTTLDKREREKRTCALLESVGLDAETRLRYAHEFSGGQRQRIGIARALAVEPDILILDEPVSALDVSVQAHILELLKDLRERLHLRYVFITHDLAVAEYLADDVMIMYLGAVMEYGPASQVLRAPQHPYTQSLRAAIPDMFGGLGRDYEPLRGEIPSPLHPPPGCVFEPRCPYAQAACTQTQIPLEASEGAFVRCLRCAKHASELSL